MKLTQEMKTELRRIGCDCNPVIFCGEVIHYKNCKRITRFGAKDREIECYELGTVVTLKEVKKLITKVTA